VDKTIDSTDLTSCLKRDKLAYERTRLAYERTFLAYIRTALTSLLSGLTILNFFKDGILLSLIAWILIIAGFVFSFWGSLHYFKLKRLISQL